MVWGGIKLLTMPIVTNLATLFQWLAVTIFAIFALLFVSQLSWTKDFKNYFCPLLGISGRY